MIRYQFGNNSPPGVRGFEPSYHETATATTEPHFGQLQRGVCALPVDHAEGDTLGLGRERPSDGGTGRLHGDGDGAVTAGLDEKLPTAVLKACDVVDREVDIKPVPE